MNKIVESHRINLSIIYRGIFSDGPSALPTIAVICISIACFLVAVAIIALPIVLCLRHGETSRSNTVSCTMWK